VIVVKPLASVAECRAAVAVQETVWGAGSEIVPASVLVASARRGGILLGAFDDDRLAGFVWSMPGWRDGVPTHWSHMLGVVPEARGRGVGERLKLAQRDHALAAGVDLVEWTFDPLQAANAHFNVAVLGVTAGDYLVDAYGAMQGALHRGTATDRLIAEWHLGSPHVARRIARRGPGGAAAAPVVRSADLLDAPVIIATRQGARWLECDVVQDADGGPRVLLPVPPAFTEMQRLAPEVAQAWRLATRRAFQQAFARGYRVVDFLIDRERGGGHYVLGNLESGI
jgi:predicted GNAT superfamily acetyltransferase